METLEDVTEQTTITVSFDFDFGADANALVEEIDNLIDSGIYPEDLKVSKIANIEGRYFDVELNFNSKDTALVFYTAYCGGDREHALSELEEFYNITF